MHKIDMLMRIWAKEKHKFRKTTDCEWSLSYFPVALMKPPAYGTKKSPPFKRRQPLFYSMTLASILVAFPSEHITPKRENALPHPRLSPASCRDIRTAKAGAYVIHSSAAENDTCHDQHKA